MEKAGQAFTDDGKVGKQFTEDGKVGAPRGSVLLLIGIRQLCALLLSLSCLPWLSLPSWLAKLAVLSFLHLAIDCSLREPFDSGWNGIVKMVSLV